MASFAESVSAKLAWVSLRLACRLALRRIDLRIEGLSHIPRQGPVILAARHFHHLWDGCALIATLPRPLRVVVALDWLEGRASDRLIRNPGNQFLAPRRALTPLPPSPSALERGETNPLPHRCGKSSTAFRLMAVACRAAGWPVVPRLAARDRGGLMAATRESVSLLRAGRMLLVFPEGYPTIDPHYTPKVADDEILPFQPGFLRFAALAERDGITRVPIIPVGLEYVRGERWQVTIRFGAPMAMPFGDEAARIHAIEARVRQLSGLSRPEGKSWPRGDDRAAKPRVGRQNA